MTNAELIEALRWNGKEYKGSTMDEDDKKLYRDAADALEAAEKRIAELEATLPDALEVEG